MPEDVLRSKIAEGEKFTAFANRYMSPNISEGESFATFANRFISHQPSSIREALAEIFRDLGERDRLRFMLVYLNGGWGPPNGAAVHEFYAIYRKWVLGEVDAQAIPAREA